MLFIFVWVEWCPTHIMLCFRFVCLRCVYRTLCCQFLWIVHFVLLLRHSLTFIQQQPFHAYSGRERVQQRWQTLHRNEGAIEQYPER
jgi:hypothetical protein